MTTPSPGPSAPARLREMLRNGAPIAAGCYDTLSGRLAELAGFQVLHVTGFGAEAAMLASPDMGLVTLTELAQHVDRIAAAVDLPMICDVDTGFGGIENIFRTVRLMERAGMAAIHMEDAGSPKRNPFVEGRSVLPREEAVGRVKAALAARRDPDFMVIARSDADCVSFDELIERCNLYLAAGADLAMPVLGEIDGRKIATLSPDELVDAHKRLLSRVDGPVLGMSGAHGFNAAAMVGIGYKVVIMPTLTVLPAIQAMWAAVSDAADSLGVVAPGGRPKIESVGDILDVFGIHDYVAKQRQFGPSQV